MQKITMFLAVFSFVWMNLSIDFMIPAEIYGLNMYSWNQIY